MKGAYKCKLSAGICLAKRKKNDNNNKTKANDKTSLSQPSSFFSALSLT